MEPGEPLAAEIQLAGGAERTSIFRRARENDFLRHGFLLFASSTFVAVCGYAYQSGCSRILGVANYGALYALLAILPLAGIPSGVLSTVIVKFAAEFRVLHDESHLHALVSRLTLWLGVVASVVIVAATLFREPIATFLNVPVSGIIPTGALIGVALMSPALRAVLQGTQDFVQYAISASIEGILKVALGVGLALTSARLFGAIAGFAMGSFVALVYTFVLLQRRYGGFHATELHIDWTRILQTLGGALVGTLTITLLGYADILLVKHYMPAESAGLYASASLGGKILLFVAGFLPMVLLPKAADRCSRGATPLPIFGAALALLAAFSLPGLLIFYFMPSLVLHLLVGARYGGAAQLLFGYGLAMVFLAGMGLVANYKIAIHRFDFAIPFCLVSVGEIVAIVLHHPTLAAVIRILIIGNLLGLISGFYRITSWQGRGAASAAS